jgi:hemolysin activation/secretion protein
MYPRTAMMNLYCPQTLAVLLGVAVTGIAQAQSVRLNPPERPGEIRPRDNLLDAAPEIVPDAEITLPELTEPPEPDRLSSEVLVFVKRITISGNTVFSPDELGAVALPYVGRELDSDGLEALRRDLTLHYVTRGYVNSGAIIPDQEVQDGAVEIHIIEGRLTGIELSGNERLRDSYIKGRLRQGNEGVLVLRRLQEGIQLLHQDRLIKRINTELRPGLGLGEGTLRVQVEESWPYELGFSFSNSRSASVGELYGQVYAAAWNLTGFGDSLSVQYGITEGLDDAAFAYAFPLNASDTRLELYYDRSSSSVVEQPFDSLNITSDTETYGARLSHPLYRTPERQMLGSVVLEKRRSETFWLDGGPFSPGPNNGRSDVAALRLVQDWMDRDAGQVIALRSTFSIGLDAFGATINPGDDPDGRFFAWLGQAQWARLLWGGQILVRTNLQWSADPLLPLEKSGVGGATSVRGYRENALVRDNAWVSSIEFRYPIGRLPIPKLSQGPDDGIVQLAPFFDYGWTDNIDDATPRPRTLSSIGMGLRWDPHPKLHGEFYWGYGFQDTGDQGSLQDAGIHFLLNAQIF